MPSATPIASWHTSVSPCVRAASMPDQWNIPAPPKARRQSILPGTRWAKAESLRSYITDAARISAAFSTIYVPRRSPFTIMILSVDTLCSRNFIRHTRPSGLSGSAVTSATSPP
ncbi:unknown [Prevotella sp. CAG:1124]|nr:unknown [Prevotella sp. CAG:1124]